MVKVNRGFEQRASRRSFFDAEFQGCAKALWELEAGKAVPPDTDPASSLGKAERCHIASCLQSMGKPGAGCTPLESFVEIQGSDDYQAERADLCPLRLDRLSIPPPGFLPVPYHKLMGEDGPESTEQFCAELLLPMEKVRERQDELGLKRCYSDPSLKCRKKYRQLIQALLQC